MAAKDKWPNVLIQFEDFPTDKAFDILDHMRDKVLCFNGELPACLAVCPWLPALARATQLGVPIPSPRHCEITHAGPCSQLHALCLPCNDCA